MADENERFVEFPELPAKTRSYDLRTVELIQPGRFTILSTSTDDADVMKFELKALDTLRSYCKRPDGNYQPPTDIFSLGPPDLPIKSIEVESSQTKLGQFKSAKWRYPYKRLAIEDRGEFSQNPVFFACKDAVQRKDEWELYLKQRASITNGSQEKEMFDCKRGLHGHFVTFDDEPAGSPNRFWPSDPAKVDMDVVRPGTYRDLFYQGTFVGG